MCFDWGLAANISASLFAGIGLFISGMAIRESNKTRQLQLLNDAFRNIHDNERLLYTHYAQASQKEKRNWDSLLFNSVEFFALLVNNRYIKDTRISEFFDDAIVTWFEEIYRKHCSKKQIKDPRHFPEFKKLYDSIKEKKKAL